ncbi:MAG: lytic murein transglycosylase [Nanoarchaeota archaeon]|nr:lytic murein transglycosylase [Nanoarchaeota archaeon]
MKTLKAILLAGALSLSSLNATAENSIESLVQHFKGKGYEIQNLISDPRFEIYKNIDKSFKTSPESVVKDYKIYREKLGVEKKKNNIKKFIQDYNQPLSDAEKKYGIPKEVIASVIGVESDFGKNIGKYYAFNSFASLFVKDYKTNFALTEMESLLKFSKKNNVSVFDLKSSYAGAIGYAQFIPSSLNSYFVGDSVYDMEDSINSVANYLKSAKKRTGKLNRAVYAYNHSEFYVKAVFEIAEAGKSNNH